MINIAVKIAAGLGRIMGTYGHAVKSANAPVGDPTAWMGGPYWGEGLLSRSKPGNKADIGKWFTSWAYICVRTNADVRSSVPTRLYVGAETMGKSWKTIGISPRRVSRARREFIESKSNLRRFTAKAADLEEVTEHRYIDLMKRPNPYMSENDMKWLTSAFMDLTGEAYWYVGVKDNLSLPVQIWVIPSMYMTPIPGKTLEEFIVGYRYKRGSVEQILDPGDVIHFRNPNPLNEYIGFSPMVGLADSLYVNSKMYEFEESVFENKARAGGVIETEHAISQAETERLKTDFKQKYEGASKSGKTILLPPGMKFSKDTMTPEELSFIEGKRVTALEICAGFSTPYALFDPNAIRANVEGAQYSHAKYGIQPWLTRYDDTLNGDLMLMYDPAGQIFVCSDNPVPEDKAYLLQKRTVDIQTGVSVINEERAIDGKDPLEGGDEPLVNGMLVPLSQVVKEPEPPPAPIIVPVAGQGKPGEDGPDEEGDLETGEKKSKGGEGSGNFDHAGRPGEVGGSGPGGGGGNGSGGGVSSGDSDADQINPLGHYDDSAKEAFSMYCGTSYGSINSELRKGTLESISGEHGDQLRGYVKSMDRVIASSSIKDGGVYYRAIRGEMSDPFVKSMMTKGAVFEDKGFVSISSDRESAERRWSSLYQNKIMVHIRVPSGSKGFRVGNRTYKPDTEHETILGRGHKFRVASVKRSGKKIDIHLDMD